MNICRNCKFWGFPEYASNEDRMTTPNAFCCEKMSSQSHEPVDPATLAWAEDREIYQADVVTKPDFGCVMFEPME